MAIIFIGKEFKYKNFLQNYILKKYKTDKIYFYENLEFDIEKIIKENSEILIITNEKLYSTTSKIVATLNDDSLEVRENQLIPSKTILYEKNSFLLELNNTIINILKYTDYLPAILLKNNRYYKLHIFNYDKDTVELFVKSIFESFNVIYTIYENEGGWCEIVISCLNEMLLKQLKGFIPHIIVSNNIFEYLKERLETNNKKITFAESCTGGLIASYLTKIAGSSSVFDGSVVSYANEIKSKWLGVDEIVLEKFGAVSEETVQQMLLGILEISDSDYAIAVSGIAGPSGGTLTKPVGTVFIGVSDKSGKFVVERVQLNGSREEIQYKTMMNAIRIFINFSNFL
jgi:nicotinamide-nucleotide amidase